MFQKLLDNFKTAGLKVPNLELYLQRHIDVDGDSHGPLAEAMIQELCDTEEKYQEAFDAAKEAIEMRIFLWEGIHRNL